MIRYVLTIDLRNDPAAISEYREYHAHAWPEVTASLVRAGIQQMDIYLLDRRLVMIVEVADGVDPAAVFARHAQSSPRVAEWERLMKSLQEPAPGARPGEWWARMEPVFHLSADSGPEGSRAPDRLQIP